jgi:von Willebrand factor type A domain
MRKKLRTNSGQAVTVLNLIIGLFVVGAIGLVSFEVSRLILAREQLRTIVQLAALTAETAAASTGQPGIPANQTSANAAALSLIQKNAILGQLLTTSSISQVPSPMNPWPDQALFYFDYVDPLTQQAATSSSLGTLAHVTAVYNYSPLFCRFLSLSQHYLITMGSGAGVPNLDVEIGMDLAGAMDDVTPVTFTQRYWQTGQGPDKIVYMVPPANGGGLAEGNLNKVFCKPTYGSNVNTVLPQSLQEANTGTNPPPCPIKFSEMVPSTSAGLRGVLNAGAPPGNYAGPGGTWFNSAGQSKTGTPGYFSGPNYFASGSQAFNTTKTYYPTGPINPAAGTVLFGPTTGSVFTDIVTNLDDNQAFSGFSSGGYDFPTVGALVEASRGNLESTQTAQAAGLDLAGLGVTPQAGYLTKYIALARAAQQPFGSVVPATQSFLTAITSASSARLGFMGFNSDVGNSPNFGQNVANVSACYIPGGNTTDPAPCVSLGAAATNLPVINALMPGLKVYGNRAVASCLREAIKELQKAPRPDAAQVIVLVVSGTPSVDLSLTYNRTTALADARMEAAAAKAAGITIFVVGIAQSTNQDAKMDAAYTDTNSNPVVGGIAGIAGGSYYRVDYTTVAACQAELYKIYGNIERQLITLN